MKKLLSAFSASFIFAALSAQEPAAPQQPAPPVVKSESQNTQKSTQNSSSSKSEEKKADDKSGTGIDNKIAVNDPGAPGDKSSGSKKAASTSTKQPADKKQNSSTGVTPK